MGNYFTLRTHTKISGRQRPRVCSRLRTHEHFTPARAHFQLPVDPPVSPHYRTVPLLMPIRAREDFKPQSHGCGLTRFPGALRRHQSELMSRAISASSCAGFLRLLCSASTSTIFCKVGAELSRITRSLDFGFYLRTCMSSADFSSDLFCYY